MIKLTRELSNLFAAIALLDLNVGLTLERQKVARSDDLESILSSSLVGYGCITA